MADEKLVADLAEHLAQRMFTEGRFLPAEGMPARWEDMPADQQRAWIKHVRENTARPTLAWLAERGRLVPDGAEVVEEWGMRYRINGKPTSPEDTGHVFSSREEAELHLQVWRREYPMLIYTEVEYLQRDEITTPWVAVPGEPA